MEDLVAGVDEVGRGAWAGPIVAGAVILDPMVGIKGLADSKKLTEKRRNEASISIRGFALAWALGEASPAEIDEYGIDEANFLAMARAVDGLAIKPSRVFVDGVKLPELLIPCEAFPNGDAFIPSISAASIIAKVARDAQMVALDEAYPGYGFAGSKGYGTKAHQDGLARLGVSETHRRSYAPVRKALQSSGVAAPSATPRLASG